MSNGRNVRIFHEYLRAIERNDADALRAAVTADAWVWYNFKGGLDERERVVDIIPTIVGIRSQLKSLRYEFDLPQRDTEDGFVVQAKCHATTLGGTSFVCPACYVGTVDDQGLITGYTEWIDPRPMEPVLAEMTARPF